MAEDGNQTEAKGVEDLGGRLEAIKILSVIVIVFGALCFAFGIPTIVLTASNPTYPFSSGSGIYGGILALLAGVFGLLFLKEIKSGDLSKLKCYNITYRVFLSIGLDVGALHFAYGIWSLVVCSQGLTEPTCGGINWTANYLLAAVNMTIGLTILVICIVNFIVAWTVFKRTWEMAKVQAMEMEAKK